MQFKNDIFISYAHLDNIPVTDGDQGWVSGFHRSLFGFVTQYLGKKPRVWRDTKLQGNGKFGPEIIEALEQAAVLVAILSPCYVVSDWCQREVQTFYDRASQSSNPCPVDQRMFKVLKFPWSQEHDEPNLLQELLGYRFYREDLASGKVKEIRPDFGRVMEEEYKQKIADLAIEITQQLKALSQSQSAPMTVPAVQEIPTRCRTVYLAETTGELQIQRNKIKRELEQVNYTVLPDRSLPYDSSFRSVVTASLERSCLSIHLFGEQYGIVPEGEMKSVVILQHELALHQTTVNPDLRQILWLSPEVQSQDPRLEAFRQTLGWDADLLQMSGEDLKTHIQEQLNPPPVKRSQSFKPNDLIRIYVICDKGDMEEIDPLTNFLRDQGFEVMKPFFGNEAAAVRRQEHQEYLELSDAVLIYYGAGDEQWQREQLRYLQRVERYSQRTHALLAKAILIRDPATSAKQKLRTREALVLDNMGTFDASVLKPFLEAIAQGQGGRTA